MTIDSSFRDQIKVIFRPLNHATIPGPASLSKALRKKLPRGGTKYVDIGRTSMSQFGTAAVDMWLRSVHSFLISNSLTDVSPVWASVSGYYSSHYSVRGLAHLLGYFNLHNAKLVSFVPERGNSVCAFDKKDTPNIKNRGEHQLYWLLVKNSPAFKDNPLFTANNPFEDVSDSAHRNHANYADHLHAYPTLSPLEDAALKDRIDRISKISFTDPRIPAVENFPDIEAVQLVAYHRLVTFRRILDEVLEGRNVFWNVHRDPPFARDYMNFQLPEGNDLI